MQILVTDGADFFGPNMSIADLVSRCLNETPSLSFGEREQNRDFTHIVDIIEATLEQLNSNAVEGVMYS